MYSETEHLCSCFPGISPVYVEECLAAHHRMSPADRINAVTDKLLELNGYYPR
jgi:hypothetical protein